jgi:nanoRNase/pAp phosphatase (c-di-AMP/oligoRNAs hydrolase)
VQIQKILALIDKLNAKVVVLLCHNNADPDAIGAAYAFSGMLKHLRPKLKIEIAAAAGPSRISKAIMAVLPIELVDQPRIEEADMLVLVDTNTIQQLGEWCTRIKPDQPLLVVDHHASHPKTEHITTLSVAEDTASSTCEVVYSLFKEADVKPSSDEAKALFLGIAYDTRHFIIASSETFKVVAELIDIGINVQEILPILSSPMEHSERIARLKASTRLKLLIINNWLIAFSQVSAYQASVARALISLGAHIAIVAGQKDDKIQVSFRATQEFYKDTGIHVGIDLARPLGDFLGGMGGGHAVSAGANGLGDVKTCLRFCSRLIRNKLKQPVFE